MRGDEGKAKEVGLLLKEIEHGASAGEAMHLKPVPRDDALAVRLIDDLIAVLKVEHATHTEVRTQVKDGERVLPEGGEHVGVPRSL